MKKIRVFLLIIVLLVIALFLFNWVMKKIGGDCSFEDFDNHREIITSQTLPQKRLVVNSGENKDIVLIFDVTELLDYRTEECKPSHYKITTETGEWEDRYDTKMCEPDRQAWMVAKSIFEKHRNNINRDTLFEEIEKNKFSRENDSSNLILEFNRFISSSLEDGEVVVMDGSGKMVNSIIYESSGSANCYDTFGEYSYKLKDGTVFRTGPLGLSGMLRPF